MNIWRLKYQSYEASRMLEGSECRLTTQECRVKIHKKLIFLPILSLLFSFLLVFLLILIFPSSTFWWSSICPTIWTKLSTGHVGVNPTSHLRYPSIKSRLIWLKLKKNYKWGIIFTDPVWPKSCKVKITASMIIVSLWTRINQK